MRNLVYALLMIFAIVNIVFADDITIDNAYPTVSLQQLQFATRLYVPHFVLIGEDANFKVFTLPNRKVRLVLDYDNSSYDKVIELISNDKGVAIFTVGIVNDKNLVGKSVGIDAYMIDDNNNLNKKAVMYVDKGSVTNSNRVEITDNESAKGFMFSPMQSLNNLIMNNKFDEKSGFNPTTDLKYEVNTPVYIRNMRDAQENVREIPASFSNSNR